MNIRIQQLFRICHSCAEVWVAETEKHEACPRCGHKDTGHANVKEIRESYRNG